MNAHVVVRLHTAISDIMINLFMLLLFFES